MINALLALALTLSDVPLVDVEHGTLTAKDGTVTQVTGGVWIEDALLIERATQMQALADENKRLKTQSTQAPPQGNGVFVAVVVGLVVGAVTAAVVVISVRP